MHAPSVIEKKRDGKILSDTEIRDFISGYTTGKIADYQMSALAMAIYFKGMTPEETTSLTRAMLDSGKVFEYPTQAPRVVDKHSTGGIGDKVSLVLAPLLACDDLWVPMISGRGLGITGGTLDKLEAIPGFNVFLSRKAALAQLEAIGVVMMGQTPEVCPADKMLYALRDVTATVPSQPLIVASIMSKKLAETLDSLVLDVKYGSGAFMKKKKDAISLAGAMKRVGEAMGVETHTVLNPMNEPLGQTVGNALEVRESIETLKGGGPADLRRIVIKLAAKLSTVGAKQLGMWLDDGTAWSKFRKMVEAQGGDESLLDGFSKVHPAKVVADIKAKSSGEILEVDADTVGRASVALGAGRSRAEDDIDFSVGFDQIIKIGTKVKTGDLVGRVHAANKNSAVEGAQNFSKAVIIG